MFTCCILSSEQMQDYTYRFHNLLCRRVSITFDGTELVAHHLLGYKGRHCKLPLSSQRHTRT